MKSKLLLLLFAALALSLQLGGCSVGGIVRSATWDDDPKPFLVVIRDFGQMERYKPGGTCTIVWDKTIMRNLDARWYFQNYPDGGRGIDCARANHSPPPSAGFSWTRRDKNDFDLSLPKSSRSGPLVLTEEVLALPRESRFVGGGIGKLNGRRFGSSPFCQVYVRFNSLTAVLNTGPEKDIHVFSGTGTRECSGPF